MNHVLEGLTSRQAKVERVSGELLKLVRKLLPDFEDKHAIQEPRVQHIQGAPGLHPVVYCLSGLNSPWEGAGVDLDVIDLLDSLPNELSQLVSKHRPIVTKSLVFRRVAVDLETYKDEKEENEENETQKAITRRKKAHQGMCGRE